MKFNVQIRYPRSVDLAGFSLTLHLTNRKLLKGTIFSTTPVEILTWFICIFQQVSTSCYNDSITDENPNFNNPSNLTNPLPTINYKSSNVCELQVPGTNPFLASRTQPSENPFLPSVITESPSSGEQSSSIETIKSQRVKEELKLKLQKNLCDLQPHQSIPRISNKRRNNSDYSPSVLNQVSSASRKRTASLANNPISVELTSPTGIKVKGWAVNLSHKVQFYPSILRQNV